MARLAGHLQLVLHTLDSPKHWPWCHYTHGGIRGPVSSWAASCLGEGVFWRWNSASLVRNSPLGQPPSPTYASCPPFLRIMALWNSVGGRAFLPSSCAQPCGKRKTKNYDNFFLWAFWWKDKWESQIFKQVAEESGKAYLSPGVTPFWTIPKDWHGPKSPVGRESCL